MKNKITEPGQDDNFEIPIGTILPIHTTLERKAGERHPILRIKRKLPRNFESHLLPESAKTPPCAALCDVFRGRARKYVPSRKKRRLKREISP